MCGSAQSTTDLGQQGERMQEKSRCGREERTLCMEGKQTGHTVTKYVDFFEKGWGVETYRGGVGAVARSLVEPAPGSCPGSGVLLPSPATAADGSDRERLRISGTARASTSGWGGANLGVELVSCGGLLLFSDIPQRLGAVTHGE